MAPRWLIFSGEKIHGPWSAVEVRSELRSGLIEPFDLAARESGGERRPLIEVDELFASDETLADSPYAIGTHPQHPSEVAERDTVNRPKVLEVLASPGRVAMPKTNKSYQILVPGRKASGVYSSREILSLWYAKKLPPHASIRRIKDHRAIEILRFVAFYEKTGVSAAPFLAEQKSIHNGRKGSLLFAFLAILFVGLTLWLATEWRLRRASQKIGKPTINLNRIYSESQG